VRRRLSTLAAALGLGAVLALAAASSASALSLHQIGEDATFAEPTYVTSDPSDPNRLFVVQRDGVIKLTTGGQTTTFLDLASIVSYNSNGGGEDGLLSMAFAPDYAQTGRFYVAYSGSENPPGAVEQADMHVDEFTASGNSAQFSTRREVLTVPQDEAPNPAFHYGGQLQFGPGGHLYISVGDGGPQEDPNGNAQDPTDLLGKMLRIDPKPGGGYTIPAGNPFVGPEGTRDEIWSIGLRNPWRFSFDRETDALVIGDVGYGDREEIDYRPQILGGGRGNNFGWNCREGTQNTGFGGGGCGGAFTDPVFEYDHDANPSCESITGGYVVRDPELEELQGRYVYSDYCIGNVRSVTLGFPASDDRSEGISVGSPTSFGEDCAGRIYVADQGGPVYRLEDFTPSSPTPADCASSAGQSDTKAPSLDLGGKDKQKLRKRKIRLTFTSDEAATLDVDGEVTAESGKKRLFGLRTKHRQLEAGVKAKITWKLSKKRARRCRKRIRKHRRVFAGFDVTAIDAAGNGAPSQKRVRLVRK
jgi:glucose/arabinose dehydrogenase